MEFTVPSGEVVFLEGSLADQLRRLALAEGLSPAEWLNMAAEADLAVLHATRALADQAASKVVGNALVNVATDDAISTALASIPAPNRAARRARRSRQ